jgi:hypothetical protein
MYYKAAFFFVHSFQARQQYLKSLRATTLR